MKCNHRGADGESSVIKGRCGICGAVEIYIEKNTENELEINMNKLKSHIEKIENQNARYIQENKILRETIKNLSKII